MLSPPSTPHRGQGLHSPSSWATVILRFRKNKCHEGKSERGLSTVSAQRCFSYWMLPGQRADDKSGSVTPYWLYGELAWGPGPAWLMVVLARIKPGRSAGRTLLPLGGLTHRSFAALTPWWSMELFCEAAQDRISTNIIIFSPRSTARVVAQAPSDSDQCNSQCLPSEFCS